MNIPDILIECLRCTNSAPLLMTAAQQDAEGIWRPINPRRPADWVAWPGSILDQKTGICPRCVPEWSEAQAQFLVTFSKDETITLRSLQTSLPEEVITNSIPIAASPISAAQFALADTLPPVQHHAPRAQNAIAKPTLPSIAAAPVLHSTIMAAPALSATVHATPISTKTHAVHVATSVGVKLAAPVRTQKIEIRAGAPIHAAPISTPIPHSSSPTNSRIVEVSAPVPIETSSK